MWIFLSDAFFSIVKPRGPDNKKLMVRARIAGDIERHFPGHRVTRTSDADYRFRAFIDEKDVLTEVAAYILNIDYSNFKNTVCTNHRHDAYMGVWTEMFRYQEKMAKFDAPAPPAPRPITHPPRVKRIRKGR